jgi:hypothetical protein
VAPIPGDFRFRKVRFAGDSPLEGTGFELSVPPLAEWLRFRANSGFGKSGSQETRRWREPDSNPRSRREQLHDLVEPVACTPAAGWEKGQVGTSGLVRQWVLYVAAAGGELG